jgi:hypothetical protein
VEGSGSPLRPYFPTDAAPPYESNDRKHRDHERRWFRYTLGRCCLGPRQTGPRQTGPRQTGPRQTPNARRSVPTTAALRLGIRHTGCFGESLEDFLRKALGPLPCVKGVCASWARIAASPLLVPRFQLTPLVRAIGPVGVVLFHRWKPEESRRPDTRLVGNSPRSTITQTDALKLQKERSS